MTAYAQIVHFLRQRAAVGASTYVYVLCGVGVAAMWPTFRSLGAFWNSSHDYGHGYLVAAVSVAWLLRSRQRLDSVPRRPMPIALVPLALAVLTWVVAYRGNSQIAQQVVSPAILLFAVFAATGRHVAFRAAAPILYLYFAVPLWDLLVPVLQAATTEVSEALLRMLGVPATVESHVVTIPEGRFTIVEGCAGKRYFIVALAFAVLGVAAQGLRGARAAVVIAAAAGLALIANWLRVVTIIYAGHVTNMEHYLVATEHATFGVLVFVPILVGIVLIVRVASRNAPRERVIEHAQSSDARNVAAWPALACLCVPVFVASTTLGGSLAAPRLGQLPILVDVWQGPLPAQAEWQPRFARAADGIRAAYASGEGTVQLYMNVYGAQSQGQELISYDNSLLPANWTILHELPSQEHMDLVVAADTDARQWVIASTYAVGGKLTSVGFVAQAYYGLHSIVRPVASGTIALAAVCNADCSQAATRVQSFWRQHSAALLNMIPTRL
jgi:EpsI family protein